MAKKTAKKPAPAKGKVAAFKPIKMWVVPDDGDITAACVYDDEYTAKEWKRILTKSGDVIPVLIVPAKGYTVTPAGGRGKKR